MEKNYVIVYFRVIAMLMIVLFHCYCYNFGVWPFLVGSPSSPYGYYLSPVILSTLGLSTFVVISGYLYGFGFFHLSKYKDNSDFLKKKYLRLIVPYIVWALITYISFPASVYWKQMFGGIAHLWFLLMLFNCFFITTTTRIVWENLGKFGSVWLIFFLYLITFLENSSILNHLWPLAINKSIPWLYLFFLGLFLGKYKIFHYISVHIIKQIPPRWVLFMDRNSMGVYILHHTFIWLAIYYSSSVREFMINNPIYAPWCLFLVVLPLSLVCTAYISKSKYSIYIFV